MSTVTAPESENMSDGDYPVTTLDSGHEEHHFGQLTADQQVRANRWGLWLFFFSEIFLFGALLMARFFLWGNTRPDLDQMLGLITTSVLLVSSYFMVRAETAIQYGDNRAMLRNLIVTFILGSLFLVGVVGFEWGLLPNPLSDHPPLRPWDGAYGAIFFFMTGIHALHVLSGLILIAIIYRNGRRDMFTAESHWGVEACAVYWHYVDVIWIFFYPALYLIGTTIH